MTVTKTVLAATMVCLTIPVVPALAHDEHGYPYRGEHWQLHQQLSGAHRRAHEEGFDSWAEHRAYHRALREMHEDFHEDHPGAGYHRRPQHWGYWGPRY